MSYDQNRKKLQELLIRYQQGSATEQERAFVEKYYRQFEQEPNLSDAYSPEEQATMENRSWQQLMERIGEPAPLRVAGRGRFLHRWGWAAACMAALLLGGIYYWLQRPSPARREQVVMAAPDPATAVAYIRSIMLPDGSHAVLQANSRLQFPQAFSGKAREVTLVGEAYFDIVHREAQPFIIHTGSLRTTVLGTAFNIRAWPGQESVQVSVTSGKVRVEDGKQVSVELTSNEQITYQTAAATVALHKVDAAATAARWAQADMIFRDEPLEKVAAAISKRYNVQVLFNNEHLKQCELVASFSGTEALETVLQTLSAILNIQYTRSGNRIVFDGAGCGEQ